MDSFENKETTDLADGEAQTDVAAVPAWEQIEDGRFRPRRVRGSNRGRELG